MRVTASIEWPFDTADPRQVVLLRTIAERAAYGNVIRGLVHELRNPMQSMMMASQALMDDGGHEGNQTLLDVIQRGADQSANCIDFLSDVIGEGPPTTGPVSLQDVIEWATNCQLVSRYQINGPIDHDIPANLPAVAAYERDLGTVLTLVLNNAKESIGADRPGSILVTASLSDDDSGVVIAVEDTGAGMAPETFEEAFEPYYTTKSSEHLGIGLTAARNLLTCYDARIRLRPNAPRGLRCELWIPKWNRVPS